MDTGQLEHVLRRDKGPVFRLVASIDLVIRISNGQGRASVFLVGVLRLFDESKPRMIAVVVNEILLDGRQSSIEMSVFSALVSAVLERFNRSVNRLNVLGVSRIGKLIDFVFAVVN